MDVISELRKLGKGLPAKAPPVPFMVPGMGLVGHLENRRGLYVNSAIERPFRSFVQDQVRAEIAAREVSDGRFGGAELAAISQRMSDTTDVVRAIKSMHSSLASWDDFVQAKMVSGKVYESPYLRQFGGSTNVWRNFVRQTTVAWPPMIGVYGSIPGPPALNSDSGGCFSLPMSLGADERLYLTNLALPSQNTGLFMLVDLVQAAGGISVSIVTTQDISTTALPRYTGGEGLMMVLETIGSTGQGSVVTINYVNQAGNPATAPVVSFSVNTDAHLIPPSSVPTNTESNFIYQLAAGDYGIRSVSSLFFATSMNGPGAQVAMLVYKPIICGWMPNIALDPQSGPGVLYERSTPIQLGGVKLSLPTKPYLTWFFRGSASGVWPSFAEFIWG